MYIYGAVYSEEIWKGKLRKYILKRSHPIFFFSCFVSVNPSGLSVLNITAIFVVMD